MANEYLRLNDVQLNKQKAENILAIIEDKRKDGILKKEIQSESSLFSELFNAFKDFFSNLGKPTIKKRLFKEGSPARSGDFNDTMVEINNDIHVAYKEVDSLSSVVVKDFNYSEVERQMLLNKVRKLGSDTTDYSLYASGAKSQSIFASDSFIDGSKIDYAFISSGVDPAELVTGQGVVTLKRTGNIDKNFLVHKVAGIKESIPAWDPSKEMGGYEGLYFGVKNEARPEGGSWHITYSLDGQGLYEHGASEVENMPNRLKMFDNNPDTFWEVEIITSPISGYKDKVTGKQISVAEFNALVENDISSAGVVVTGGTVTTGESGSLIERYIPISGTSSGQYLTCSLMVSLSELSIINWISLNPNNFGHEMYLEIVSIQTSEDGKVFSELEGFDDHEFETVLTPQANSELNPLEVKDTLSPDKFKYAGLGVWTFSPRKVKSIRFDLRQTKAYIKDYDVVVVEVERTVTTTTTTSKFFGLSKSSSTSSKTVRKNVEIPYLTGLVCGYDVMSLEPGQIGTSIKGNWANKVSDFLSNIPIVNIIGSVIGGLFGSTKTTSTSVSPQKINRQWTTTKSDRSRFAIGIRDINLYSYKFAAISEIVSKSYSSPAPIAKLTLTVDEQIPTIFYSDPSRIGTDNDWIKYFISVNNGASWSRISPMQHRSTVSEDGVNFVPEIININSDVAREDRDNPLAYIDTSDPAYEVRLKAVLSRPTDINDADSYTPALSQYNLQIYPLGGL
jgi:hypothetical protein